MTFDNLPARGIAAGSQSLVLWKDRQYADTPNDATPGNALQLDMSAYAQTDPLLLVPAADDGAGAIRGFVHPLLRAVPRSVLRLGARPHLPDQRLATSRPTPQGHRLLSAGFHSLMGYFRDDGPLYELILDEAAAA